MKYILFILILLIIFINNTQSLYFLLTDGKEKCISDEIPKGEDVKLEYQLIDAFQVPSNSAMVELKMYDPEKKIIKEISIRDASKQTFAFVAFKAGNYKFCYKITSGKAKQVRFSINLKIGETEEGIQDLVKAGDFADLEEKAKKLDNKCQNYIKIQDMNRAAEDKLYELSEMGICSAYCMKEEHQQTNVNMELIDDPKKSSSGEPVHQQESKKEPGQNNDHLLPTQQNNYDDSQQNDQASSITDSNALIQSTLNCTQRKELPAITLENGAVYVGQWKLGMRDGMGDQKWPDGSRYKGEWSEDKAHGQGMLIHADGDIYEGAWQFDKAHGRGTYTHANGAKYEGEWKEDRQHGKGMETWPDGARYEGEYQFGKKHGKGVLLFADGSTYDGEFVQNDIQGTGVYSWPDERKYVGQWFRNKMHGKGKIQWPDGREYEGDYQDDKKHGFGVFKWNDGRQYKGQWLNGKQHGKGEYLLANGVYLFEQNQLVLKQSRIGEWIEGKRAKWMDE